MKLFERATMGGQKIENLKAKIDEIKQKFPEVTGKLDPWKREWDGMYSSAKVTDVAYSENESYQVVAAKWHMERFSHPSSGGTEWIEWCELHHKEKPAGKINSKKTEEITIRDRYDPNFDRRDLWCFHEISLSLSERTARLAWLKDGVEGIVYNLPLK